MKKMQPSAATAARFRSMALGFAGASESAHMDHPDFRVAGKIFASLGYPDADSGMVKLLPEQQQTFIRESPAAFTPCNGAWGRNGATSVHLATVTADTLQAALETAWQNVVKKAKKKSRRTRVRQAKTE